MLVRTSLQEMPLARPTLQATWATCGSLDTAFHDGLETRRQAELFREVGRRKVGGRYKMEPDGGDIDFNDERERSNKMARLRILVRLEARHTLRRLKNRKALP